MIFENDKKHIHKYMMDWVLETVTLHPRTVLHRRIKKGFRWIPILLSITFRPLLKYGVLKKDKKRGIKYSLCAMILGVND